MTRVAFALLLLAGLAGCGVETSVRDLNKSLYRTFGGGSDARQRPVDTSSSAGTPCFSAETGLLYTSQTGRCAPGYAAIGIDQAAQQFQASTQRAPVAGRSAPEIAPMPSRSVAPATAGTSAAPGTVGALPQSNVPPSGPGGVPSQPYRSNEARVGEGIFALCYNDTSGHVFEAPSCPPGSRWINSDEAELLQRAQLAEASWCFFPGRSVLYRSRACRPGDQKLNVAEADRVWDTLPADRRTRARPSATGGGVMPVPAVDAAPRGGVNATPLPAPR
ncbi:hypothetical protein [Ferrovibrio terrae]|uniref:hypothetical protein n=1 Tax=Ferrovibrio terrae TaxID=2594003 RepID=UPI003137F7C1